MTTNLTTTHAGPLVLAEVRAPRPKPGGRLSGRPGAGIPADHEREGVIVYSDRQP